LLCQVLTSVSHITTLHLLNLKVHLFLRASRDGPELMLVHRLLNISLMRTKLFLPMVENTLTKVLFFAQVSNIVIP